MTTVSRMRLKKQLTEERKKSESPYDGPERGVSNEILARRKLVRFRQTVEHTRKATELVPENRGSHKLLRLLAQLFRSGK